MGSATAAAAKQADRDAATAKSLAKGDAEAILVDTNRGLIPERLDAVIGPRVRFLASCDCNFCLAEDPERRCCRVRTTTPSRKPHQVWREGC